MVTYLAVLIAALTILSTVPCSAAPVGNQCLACHPVHYGDQGSCSKCHRGNARTSRKSLAHSDLIKGVFSSFTDPQSAAVVAGKRLAEQSACRRCHVLSDSGNRLATNLDSLLLASRPDAIRESLLKPALYMPDFHFSERDLDRLVTTVLAGGWQSGKSLENSPIVVYFSNLQAGQQNIFSKNCGGCHKLISKQHGGLGIGTTGPNLSSLFSRFYPASFESAKQWNEERLKRWLKNPRDIRKNATMPPIEVKLEDWQPLLKIFEEKNSKE